MFERWSQERGTTVFLTGIMVSLESALTSDQILPCDPNDYDLYSGARLRYIAPETALSHMAFLSLYHPTSPSAWPMFHIVTSDQRRMDRLWTTARWAAQDAWCRASLRAAYILRCQGHNEEATQLESIVEERSPRLWQFRHTRYAVFAEDPKVKGLQWLSQTTGSETAPIDFEQVKQID